MNLKSLLFLIPFLCYCAICWKIYTCDIKGFCNYSSNDLIVEVAAGSAPIQFNKNTDTEVLSNFESYCDSIKTLTLTSRVDIAGQYFTDEENSTSFPNLGIARAQKLRDLLISCGVDSTKLSIVSQKMEAPFTSQVNVATAIAAAQIIDINSTDVQIISNHGVTEIYFPSNSTKEMVSETLDNFLIKTISDAKGKKIYLTGHTDNVGIESANLSLSINRCIAIKEKMIKFGAEANQVVCEGKGSQSPKVNNSSEENRALNRRVEVSIQ